MGEYSSQELEILSVEELVEIISIPKNYSTRVIDLTLIELEKRQVSGKQIKQIRERQEIVSLQLEDDGLTEKWNPPKERIRDWINPTPFKVHTIELQIRIISGLYFIMAVIIIWQQILVVNEINSDLPIALWPRQTVNLLFFIPLIIIGLFWIRSKLGYILFFLMSVLSFLGGISGLYYSFAYQEFNLPNSDSYYLLWMPLVRLLIYGVLLYLLVQKNMRQAFGWRFKKSLFINEEDDVLME